MNVNVKHFFNVTATIGRVWNRLAPEPSAHSWWAPLGHTPAWSALPGGDDRGCGPVGCGCSSSGVPRKSTRGVLSFCRSFLAAASSASLASSAPAAWGSARLARDGRRIGRRRRQYGAPPSPTRPAGPSRRGRRPPPRHHPSAWRRRPPPRAPRRYTGRCNPLAPQRGPSHTPPPFACLHTSRRRTRPVRTSCAAARPPPVAACAPSSLPPSPLPQTLGLPLPAPVLSGTCDAREIRPKKSRRRCREPRFGSDLLVNARPMEGRPSHWSGP
jgi:hypothetical protein